MKKQITSATLAAVTMLGMAAAPAQSIIPALQTAIVASAADYEVYGDLHYQTDGKQVFIVGYNSDTTNSVITIPSKIKGLPVTKIEDHAFDSFLGYDKNLRGIIIESGVKTIGNYAFSSQDKMTSIVLSSTLTSIG